MNREQKTALVEEIAGQIGAAGAIFAVDYRGLSVTDAASLRERLRESDTRFRIVKNSLTERAADQAGVAELKPLLEGPTALALVAGDAALAAKALNEAARASGILEFKGGLMDGATLSGEEIRSIARLPSREVLHAQLVGTISSPVSGLVRTLNALLAGLAVQLQGIADQGLVGGEAPTAGSEPVESEEAEGTADDEGESATSAETESAGSDDTESAGSDDTESVASEDTESAADGSSPADETSTDTQEE